MGSDLRGLRYHIFAGIRILFDPLFGPDDSRPYKWPNYDETPYTWPEARTKVRDCHVPKVKVEVEPPPAPAALDDPDRYDWRGMGPEPHRWVHADGMVIYRDFG